MSKETQQWRENMIVIGDTDRRGKAWWHRAGEDDQGRPNHFTGAIPIEVVRERLFNWEPVELSVGVQVPADVETMDTLSEDGHPVRWQLEPDRKAVATSDTHEVLGIFKSGYRPHAYSPWLLNNVESLLDGDLHISSAGLLRKRAVAWVEISLREGFSTPQGVPFIPSLLAATSLDGSIATTYKRNITATQCDNTLAIALAERAGATLKFKHSKNSIGRINDARVALDLVHSAADEFSKQVEALTSTPFSDQQWSNLLKTIAPIDVEDDSKRAVTLANEKRDQINAIYRTHDASAAYVGTAWGAFQAVSTYEHHVKPLRGETVRAERNMMSALNGMTEKADRQVLELLGVGGPELSIGVGL